MREIPLHPYGRGLVAKVSDDDFESLSQRKWTAYFGNRGYPYAVSYFDGKRHSMHRVVCAAKGRHVDHINGDTLDNRRENLRAVTPAENAANRHVEARSNTGSPGVHVNSRGRFIAKQGGQYIGSFAAVEDANAAISAFVRAEGDPKKLLRMLVKLERENRILVQRLAAMARAA